MKFNDIKTLEHFLKEYGSTPGAPAYSTFGQKAKAAAKFVKDRVKAGSDLAQGDIKGAMGQSSSPNTMQKASPNARQKASPNTTGKSAAPKMVGVPAKGLDDGAVFKDKDGNTVGTVISKVGMSPNPDKIVVQNVKGEYELYDPNVEVMIDEDIGHDILKKVTKQQTTKKNSIAKKIKRLSRSRLREGEYLAEINFNSKEIVNKALDLPIKCGFEAETSWEYISGSNEDVDEMSWSEVEGTLYIGSGDAGYIDEGFDEWIRENKAPDYYEDAMDTAIENARDDDDTYTRYMDESDDAPTYEAVEDYKEEMKENDPAEFQNREEDGWDEINWIREYIDENYEPEYIDWLREDLDADGDVFQEAFDEAYGDYSMDDWISDAYYTMTSFLDDYGIDYSELQGGGLEEVASTLYGGWIEDNSKFNEYPETGDYGYTSTTSGYAVESDSSIDSYGTGAEIISPVFNTPREMLDEMRSMFKFFEGADMETNNSTGLHVTMSWNGAEDTTRAISDSESAGPNKLKMAALLGDTYLLSTFGRERNSYTKQQSERLRKAAKQLTREIGKGEEGRKEIEAVLSKSLSRDKFSSINFKGEVDRDSKNQLIEFRIGGGEDYHRDMGKIVKAVIRYATIMEAGYDEDKYKADYNAMLYRIVNTAGNISKADIEATKDRFDIDNIKEPIVDVFKTLLSKDNYFDGIGKIVNAYSSKSEYEELSRPEADDEWKQDIEDYRKGTGRDPSWMGESITEEEITGYIEPPRNPPSKRAPEKLQEAQKYYLQALGILAVDVATEMNRGNVTVKVIGTLRNSLKDFDLDADELSRRIVRSIDGVNIPTQNDRLDQKINVVKKGIDELFKKDIIKAPSFIKTPMAEKVITGLWNAVGSDLTREQYEKITDLLLKFNYGDDIDFSDNEPHNMKVSINNTMDTREFNLFYTRMTKGSYDVSNPPVQVGNIYNEEYYKELMEFLGTFKDYKEPVSPNYNRNFHSDDTYVENYLNTYTMKLRKRLSYLEEMKNINPQLYYDAVKQLGVLTEQFVRTNKPLHDMYWEDYDSDFEGTQHEGYKDNSRYLAINEYPLEKLNEILDSIAKGEFESPFGENIVMRLNERMSDALREMLGSYYGRKEKDSNYYKGLEDVIENRWSGIKDWMTGFDSIAKKMGFDSQADEIADKQRVDKRETNFKKAVQNRPPISINVPEHSVLVIRKDIYDRCIDPDITQAQRQSAQVQDRSKFLGKINQAGVYIIPGPHVDQVRQAYDTLAMLNDLPDDAPLKTSQLWREPIANKIIKKFMLMYKISWNRMDTDEYIMTDSYSSNLYNQMKKAGIEVTRKGSSIDDAPLIPHEETQNKDGDEFDPVDDATSNAIAKAARVDHLDGESSETIHTQAKYDLLAPAIGIEPGVNNQGVNLLKKVVDQFQSDSTKYRSGPDEVPVIGLQRWLQAVRDARKYINANYTSGGGNYFRKDADGNPGDDVSDVYGNASGPSVSDLRGERPGDDVSEDDYDAMRRKYQKFDYMMITGMQNYLLRPDVNRFVAFLKNPDNDEEFKHAVIQKLIFDKNSGEEPNDFQGALARGRMVLQSQNESVFDRFDKLPLQEQIAKLENIDVTKINQLHEKALGRADLKTPDRRQNFADKLRADGDFTLAGGEGSIKLDPSMADAFDNAENAGQLPAKLTTADGEQVSYGTLEKTAEFGARTGGPAGDDAPVKVSNKGEVAEGILGCGTFARLLVRPSAPVTAADIENVIKQLPTDAPDQGGWHELTLTAQEVDNPIADFFTLTLNLKSDTYQDFIDPQKWSVMQSITSGVVDYVNDNLEKYTNYFQANGKVDTVKVIADGVSGETDTKVDVFLTHSLDGGPEKTLQHFDMSVKVGSTKQMGQVGGGKQTEPLSVRYGILAEMWQRFDVDISNIEQDFLNAETVEQGYKIAYTEAVRQLNSHLTSEEKEEEFLLTLLNAIKFFATLNDDRVKLVQFTDLKAGGYYVLDFKKLNRMFDKDKVDLEAKMIETAKHPKITIFNKVTNKDFLSIRMYQAGSGYIRNYIEKEKGLVDLTKVRGSGMRKKVESIREGAVPNNDTIRKLREIFAKPLLTNDIKGQMDAYVAIPDPSMIRDFRAARASYGDEHDLRSIVRSYAKLKLHDSLKKQLSK